MKTDIHIDDPFASDQLFNVVRDARQGILSLPDSVVRTGYDLLIASLKHDVERRVGPAPRAHYGAGLAQRMRRRAYRN